MAKGPRFGFDTLAAAIRRFAFGRAAKPEPVGGRGMFLPMRTVADIYVDPLRALSLSAVWGCTHAIAEGLASAECRVFEVDDEGQKIPRRGRAYNLLNLEPNPEMSAFDFWMTLILNYLLSEEGFGAAEIVLDRMGRVAELWPIEPSRLTPRRDEQGRLEWLVSNYFGADGVIPHRRMFLLRGRSLDGQTPISTIAGAREVIARAIATRDFGAAFYANGLSFGGVLTPKDPAVAINEAEVKKYAAMLAEQHGGAQNAHQLLMLNRAFELVQTGVTPDKAQFIETEQHLVEEICRYFRVPPHKVQHLLRATNNNIEHQGIEFVRDAIIPRARQISQEIDRKVLFAEARLRSMFDVEFLREGDALSVANTESVRLHSAQSCPDESRARRGENPIPGGAGKKFMAQQGMTSLDMIGASETGAPAHEPQLNPAGDRGPRPATKPPGRRAFVALDGG